ncbi:MAG: hypothetical protein GQ544_00425 [Candidatus Aminicenantes bacterium]|nr:hypothetical protein [Candidatus Aminicenantes bacterium]
MKNLKIRFTHIQKVILGSVLGVAMLLMLGPSAVGSQEADSRAFSLKQARDFAIQHNYDAQKSQMDVTIAEKIRRQTIGAGLPQINSSISYQNNLELPTVLIPDFFGGNPDDFIEIQFGTQHNASASLTVSQLVFNGSYFVGLATSRIFQQLADQGYKRTQLQVKDTVTSTYYTILISQESEKIINSNLDNLEKTLYEIRESYKEGFVEETDADNVQINVTSLKNTLQNLQKGTKTAYDLLKFQMGLDLSEEIELTETLEDVLTRSGIEEAMAATFNLNQSIDYQLTQTQEKMAEMNLKNEKTKYLPSLAAFYSLSFNAQRNRFNFLDFSNKWYRSQVLGVSVDIPLFKSGSQKAKVQQASLALNQARNTTRQVAQGLLLQDTQAQNALNAAFENYLNVKDNMGLSQKVYDVTLIKYQEGLATSLELTQANDRYLLSQSNYIQALLQLLNAKNSLDRIRNSYD